MLRMKQRPDTRNEQQPHGIIKEGINGFAYVLHATVDGGYRKRFYSPRSAYCDGQEAADQTPKYFQTACEQAEDMHAKKFNL